MNFENAEVAGFGQVDTLWTVAKVVATDGNLRRFTGEKRFDLLLQMGELGMSCKELAKYGKILVQFFEGIERIEEEGLGRTGEGFQVDP